MKKVLILLISLAFSQVAAFTPPSSTTTLARRPSTTRTAPRHDVVLAAKKVPTSTFLLDDSTTSSIINNNRDEQPATALSSPVAAAGAVWALGLSTGLLASAAMALAETPELEIAELPPPYIPALFAVGLLVGIGVLTGSLGNVIDEGAFVCFAFAIDDGISIILPT